MNNAISKHGSPDNEEVNKRILDEFLEDIFFDVKIDDPGSYNEWEEAHEDDKERITSIITRKANGLITKFNKARAGHT